ncbi:Mur ligase family protein [Paramaledivibacter caminithermalis]|jgi:UDP-N-acetylmuramoyl-L-alanyl-D-glutamate--2,6-diaminopimelate ligase|uniref:Mur ligase middle domain-containing protein n=1 Tax=Paramaledivibacter caminithermalis (strain DSM 15212 / CIP 107654 / DViRD3) TaxID=1121301 RepID=A0A1M6PZZ6_PARC5|nr:Mur ligase family protein [Paramaledivibacter caminithermalis]SHK13472.1 Mur ligase middle domain-containing protein [Paramaledivibacter caminithermalis DSM 15212]
MKRAKFVGVIKNNDNTIISDLLFSMFKNNGFQVGLMNNKTIRINENCKKIKINDNKGIEELLLNFQNLDYIILDNLHEEYLYKLIEKFEIDALIDDSFIENYEIDKNVEVKKIMFNNLKRNGISIINSDNKSLNKYFKTLKDKIVVTYGLNSKSTITASSLDIDEKISFNCCIQRGITTSNGNEIEQMEFPIKVRSYDTFKVSDFLAVIGLFLIYEVSIEIIQDTIYKFDVKMFV